MSGGGSKMVCICMLSPFTAGFLGCLAWIRARLGSLIFVRDEKCVFVLVRRARSTRHGYGLRATQWGEKEKVIMRVVDCQLKMA